MDYTTEIVRADGYDKTDEPIKLIAKRLEEAANESSKRTQRWRLVSVIPGYEGERVSRLLLVWEVPGQQVV